MAKNDLDFTVEQASDLARHFLGPSWYARLLCGYAPLLGSAEAGMVHTGTSWRSVFRAAGVKLPYRPKFSSVGKRVVKGDDTVALCSSNSFAERTANALNAYEPDPRGK